MSKKKLLIVGFGGNAIDCVETAEYDYEIVGFVDDNLEKQKLNYNGISVYPRKIIQKYKDTKIITLIGSESTYLTRKKIISEFQIPRKRFATIIHPDASISKSAKIGYDVLIMAGVVVTSNAVIGNHIFILPNSVIHHDVVVSDYVLIGSNVTVAGHVKINQNCFIGSASSLISDIEIGKNSLIGIGTNVIKSIPEGSKIVGNPGKSI